MGPKASVHYTSAESRELELFHKLVEVAKRKASDQARLLRTSASASAKLRALQKMRWKAIMSIS